uniref:Uncharacterized protein n=1 Tax=Aegilops tauschii subsp. strangulata TaxID=200361 RepID=A0A453QNS3_AEGTS
MCIRGKNCSIIISCVCLCVGRNHAVAAAQVLQGVQVEAGGGGRSAAGAHHPRRGAVRREHRHGRLHPELLPQRLPVRPLRRRPLLRPPRRHLLRLRRRRYSDS